MFEIEQIIYIKMDLALNNLQRLICHKTKQTKPNLKRFSFSLEISSFWPCPCHFLSYFIGLSLEVSIHLFFFPFLFYRFVILVFPLVFKLFLLIMLLLVAVINIYLLYYIFLDSLNWCFCNDTPRRPPTHITSSSNHFSSWSVIN